MNNIDSDLANSLNECYEDMYNICYSLVEEIINDHVVDKKEIERVLDLVLDIYTEKGFYLFLELASYYSDIDMEASFKYLNFLKEDRKEEYDEYVKKLAIERK